MKAASDALKALLKTRQFWACHLFVFNLVGGGVLRYAGGDCDVADETGNRYSCGGMVGPYFESSDTALTTHQALGTDVDTLSLDVMPGDSTILGAPFLQAVRQGLFRGARFQLLRAYAPAPPAAMSWPITVTGTIVKFTGVVGDIDSGGPTVTMTIDSALVYLQTQWPRNFYSPGCVNALGDASCQVSLATCTANAVTLAGSSNSVILTTLPGGADYYNLGHVKYLSGVNAGLMRSISTWDASTGTLTLMAPFPDAPDAGDQMAVTPGCDGVYEGGCAKFGNQSNFRGFRTIPRPTTAT